MAKSFNASLMLLLLLFLLPLSWACFVRNCPTGGKRSQIALSTLRQRGMLRDECMSCGPFNSGVCISASVCCLALSGCRSSPSIAARCQMENASPRPCVLRGDRCGTAKRPGICVVDGVCCTGDSADDCLLDTDCIVAKMKK